MTTIDFRAISVLFTAKVTTASTSCLKFFLNTQTFCQTQDLDIFDITLVKVSTLPLQDEFSNLLYSDTLDPIHPLCRLILPGKKPLDRITSAPGVMYAPQSNISFGQGESSNNNTGGRAQLETLQKV